MRPRWCTALSLAGLVLALAVPPVLAEAVELVPTEAPMRFVANSALPPFGMEWVDPGFDDGAWTEGVFGVGYETNGFGAGELILTAVPSGTSSVFARARFELGSIAVENVHLGVDYDDGVAVWINGVEVYRSPQMPGGELAWNTPALDHESSNDYAPRLVPLIDITAAAGPALQAGENVLAVGVWNAQPGSSDLVVVPRLSVNETLALERTPYLQQGTERSIKILWRTNLLAPSVVRYGLAPDALSFSRSSGIPKTDHAITLTGLDEDTAYYYSVGDDDIVLAGGDEDHRFRTAPARGTPRSTRIWVLGDSGTGTDAARAVRDAYLAESAYRDTDLWLMLGDNAYPDGTDANYQDKLFDVFGEMLRRSVLWPTLGNHDVIRGNSVAETGAYFDIFDLPTGTQGGGAASGTESYYSFDHANVHFVVLDSNDSDRSLAGPMVTWLAADLAANDQDWLIALWHHSPYSRGSHDSDLELPLIEMREQIVPLLEDHGVDLVLTAHSHSYERSYLIDGHYGLRASFDVSMLVDGGDGEPAGDGAYAKAELGPEAHSGAVYTVAGSAGQLTGGALDHPAMARSMNVLGSVILDIDGGRLETRFLDDQGTVRDTFTLIKGCADPNLRFTSHPPADPPGSDVVTPGVCGGGPPCASDTGSTVTSDVTGVFWSLGFGDPEPGVGIDSGRYPAYAGDDEGWLRVPSGSPAFIDGNWAIDGRIDGCAGDPPAPRCMAAALSDQHNGIGYFSLSIAPEDPAGGVSFAQAGNAPILLGPLPRPRIQTTWELSSYQLAVQLTPDSLDGGVYIDEDCPGVPIRYRVYEQRTSRGGLLVDDRTLDNGDPDSGWTLSQGGATPGGAGWPVSQPTVVTLTCHTAVDVVLGISLVFGSGFETEVVSANSSRILCSDCEIDGDRDGACGQYLGGANGPDCNDLEGAVHPGGAQICGDFMNNDCDHPNWPSLIGTNEIDDDGDGFTECDGDCRDDVEEVWGIPGEAGMLEFSADGNSLLWSTPTDFGGLAVAFDTLRSSDPSDFVGQTVCIDADQGLPFAIDPAQPPPGVGFYYLVRAENACGGRLGHASGGARTARSCP